MFEVPLLAMQWSRSQFHQEPELACDARLHCSYSLKLKQLGWLNLASRAMGVFLVASASSLPSSFGHCPEERDD